MPSSYTTSLRLTLPATGELSGQWGTTVNTGITELVDSAVAGTTTISTWGGAGVPYTLSNNSGTADEARRMFIVATGTPGEAKNVICPAVSKMYVFRNDTTGGFALTLKTSGGTGIAVPAGQYKLLYCDGTNVVEAVNSLGPVASLTASQAVFTDASKNLVSNAITGTGNVVMSTSPTLVTPVLGAATATSINGLTVSSTTGTLTLANGSTLATSGANSLTMTTTGATNVTFPTSGTLATTAGTVASFSAGSTGFTPNTATTGAVTLAGTLATANGGTGLTSFTANGVVYASSTSALATGSALTFDGTNFGGGVNVLVSDNKAIGFGSNAYWLGNSASGFVAGYINGSEQMRLTSTGLGIGTSSPGQKLSVNGDTLIGTNLFIGNGAGSMVGATSPSLYSPASGTLGISTAGVERMRLDSSGNLGLGVTPSAWGSGSTALQIGNGAIWKSGSRSVDWITNGYYNGSNYIYNISNAATYYRQFDGVHSWYTAPSGTAGNAISFTQAMTLDASGNLSVGTTGSLARIAVENSSAGDGVIIRSNGFNTNKAGANNSLLLGSDYTSGISYVVAGGSSTNTTLAFYTAAAAAPQERARITSGGDLLVGTAAAASASKLDVLSSAGGVAGIGSKITGGATTQCYVAWNDATSGDNVFHQFYTETSATSRGSITYNRGAGLVAYNTTSDYRAKDILGPVANPGATIDALKVYEGQMKGATQSRPMLVAHEAQAVAPYSVTGEKDAVNEDGTPKFQQMDVSSLVPLLIAEIQSLRARVAALETP